MGPAPILEAPAPGVTPAGVPGQAAPSPVAQGGRSPCCANVGSCSTPGSAPGRSRGLGWTLDSEPDIPGTTAFLTHGVPSTRTTIVLVVGRVASTHVTQVGSHESSWIKAEPEPNAWRPYKKRREKRHTHGGGCVTRKPRECRPPAPRRGKKQTLPQRLHKEPTPHASDSGFWLSDW